MSNNGYGSRSSVLEQMSAHGMLNLQHAHDSEDFSESIEEAEDSDVSAASSAVFSGSSSDTGSDGDCANEQLLFDSTADTMELAQFGKTLLRLPRGLCEHEEIFNEFFSLSTWRMLPQPLQHQLLQHLPNFSHTLEPEEAAVAMDQTVTMLFSGELKRFGHTPLGDLQQRLEEGNLRPDVQKLRENIAKSRRREERFRQSERLSQLAKQLFLSRERLLRTVYKSGPDVGDCRGERSVRRQHHLTSQQLYADASDTKFTTMQRARKRFFTELRRLKLQVGGPLLALSADEEDDADALTVEELQLQAQDDQQASEAVTTSGSSAADKCIYSTLFKRRHDLADDEALRSEQRAKQPRLSHRNYRQYLMEHRRRKLMDPSLADFETGDIRLRDVCARAQLGGTFKKFYVAGRAPGRKPKAKQNDSKIDALVLPTPVEKGNVQPINGLVSQQQLAADIQSAPTSESSSALDACATQTLQSAGHSTTGNNNNSTSDVFLRDGDDDVDHEPFHIFDGDDVELQQEEVETFDTGEETIPGFVVSNEEVIAAPANPLPQPTTPVTPQPQPQPKQPVKPQGTMPRLQPIPRGAQKAVCANVVVGATQKQSATLSTPKAVVDASELIQETHACYFSLIRDFFCATTFHRMSFEELRARIDVWLRNPITALNDWYAQADNWSTLLASAINFLAGNAAEQPDEFVPYIEHKTHLNLYQWIGAGRDSDTRLAALCYFWLQRRGLTSTVAKDTVATTIATVDAALTSDCSNNNTNEATAGLSGVVLGQRRISAEIEDGSTYDSGATPAPAPRCPTSWTVRPASGDEVVEFQRQERERFEQPHRAYTYRMYGFESVVGPVKGIYSQTLALTKARGHSMMIGDRPNFVTILTLVRDATARLPNGEGTRADISELLKCSQYINRDAAETVLQTIVSGALDRMHTEHDPCVRYDPKRKIWIYLHRNRSEAEFERLHQQNQGLGKPRKPPQRKPKMRSALKDEGDTVAASSASENTVLSDTDAVATMVITPTATAAAMSFTMPALVPSNSIVIGGGTKSPQAAILTKQYPQQQQTPLPVKCPPVPPLKYNIPAQVAQKSLLKSAVHAQRQTIVVPPTGDGTKASTDTASVQQQQQQPHPPQQRAVLRTTASSPISAVPTQARQYNFSAPQLRASATVMVSSSASGVTATPTATTPILVATSSGLQTMHVTSGGGVTASSAMTTAIATTATRTQMLSATVGGKKVALSKPIIINQITQQQPLATKTKTAINSDGFIIPLRVAVSSGAGGPNNSSSDADKSPASTHLVRNVQTLMLDSSDSVATTATTATSTATTASPPSKNIIRFVPAATTAAQQPVGRQTQAVQIVGQRVIAKTTVRPQQQQTKSDSGVTVTTSSGGAVLKMSPQAFAALQQKQQLKSTGLGGIAPMQRVVVGNTAIIAQAGTAATYKNIVVQQRSVSNSGSGLATQKLTSNASSVNVTTLTPGKAVTTTTTTTTNLTPQQQRVLLQNLKQQQTLSPQMQFKTVQVLSNIKQQPPAEVQQQQQQSPRSQGNVQIVAQQRVANATVPTASAPKTVAVVMSPAATTVQGGGRVMKTIPRLQTQPAKETQSAHGSGTRIVSSTTGQIISLEGLLQKQGGSLRIANTTSDASGGSMIVKTVNASNIIQLQPTSNQTATATSSTAAAQYTVVTQPRNVITVGSNAVTPHRIITTPAVASSASVGGGKIVLPPLSGAGAAKLFNRATTVSAVSGSTASTSTITTTGASGAVRVINANTISSGGLNIASLQGKQLIFATKSVAAGGATIKTLGAAGSTAAMIKPATKINATTSPLPNTSHMQTVIMGNQILRVQQVPAQATTATSTASGGIGMTVTKVQQQQGARGAVSLSSNSGAIFTNTSSVAATVTTSPSSSTVHLPKTLLLGTSGQTIRLQPAAKSLQQTIAGGNVNAAKSIIATSGAGTAQLSQSTMVKSGNANALSNRVVLAVQGGGQIFLSPNFTTGNTISLKSLQNMKVVSLTQAPATVTTTTTTPTTAKVMSQELSQQQ